MSYRGANFIITGRIAPGYMGSPLLSHYPKPLQVDPSTILCVDFSKGVPKDLGEYEYSITENNTPLYQPNSPFNGLSLFVDTASDKACYIPYDSKFVRSYPFTLEAWFYIDSIKVTGTNMIMSCTESGNYSLSVDNEYLEGKVRIGGSYTTINSTIKIKEKTWYYGALTYDGINVKLFQNHDEYSVAATGQVDNVTAIPMVFGGEWNTGAVDSTLSLAGHISIGQMLSRIRTQKEIERYILGI